MAGSGMSPVGIRKKKYTPPKRRGIGGTKKAIPN